MISNFETAKQVSELLLSMFYSLDSSIAMVKKTCSPQETAAYQKAVGRVAGAIVMDVLEALYREHPSLKPHNWDD